MNCDEGRLFNVSKAVWTVHIQGETVPRDIPEALNKW